VDSWLRLDAMVLDADSPLHPSKKTYHAQEGCWYPEAGNEKHLGLDSLKNCEQVRVMAQYEEQS
jgi:hypothetical protein